MIATKFPSYLIDHPNKVVWLVHQFRQAYELDRTEHGQLERDPVRPGDPRADRGRRPVCARSGRGRSSPPRRTSPARLQRSTGLEAEVLPHPPQELDYRCDRYDPFVLSVGRLDSLKRVDLLLEAAALEPRLQVVVAGDGPDRERLELLGAELGLGDRVRFAGRVDEAALAELYATCRAVYYAPIDEDFGMVPLEAYRSSKPVVTATDSGGPLDFVVAGETGLGDRARCRGAGRRVRRGDRQRGDGAALRRGRPSARGRDHVGRRDRAARRLSVYVRRWSQ